MPLSKLPTEKLLIALLGCLAVFAQTFGQETSPLKPQAPQQPDEVIRIFTDLVQTDVMVFDKEGRFVNGLKREDFALRVDGRPQPVEFFDRVSAGSASEEAQLAAARGGSRLADAAVSGASSERDGALRDQRRSPGNHRSPRPARCGTAPRRRGCRGGYGRWRTASAPDRHRAQPELGQRRPRRVSRRR